jgi:hypothetical protein
MNERPSRSQPTVSQTFRCRMPISLQPVETTMVPTTVKNASGKNRNGPHRHIREFGEGPAMMPPVLGNVAARSTKPRNIAAVARSQRRCFGGCSLRLSLFPSLIFRLETLNYGLTVTSAHEQVVRCYNVDSQKPSQSYRCRQQDTVEHIQSNSFQKDHP